MCACTMQIIHVCHVVQYGRQIFKKAVSYLVTVAEDTKFVVCNECDKLVSRGGNSTKVCTTSNLVNHLKSLHKALYKEYEDKHE